MRDSVEVIEVPLPTVNLGKDTAICAPDEVILNAGNLGMSYEWSTGSRSQTIRVNDGNDLVWVTVTNDYNCLSSDSIKILHCSPLNYLFVPNAITPNNDGQNDVWRIRGLQYFPGATITIFDRWGRLIYVSEPDYPKPWDGQLNGKTLPMDAYYYVIDLKNGYELLRGSLTIIQ